MPVRRPTIYWLWMLVIAVASFAITTAIANAFVADDRGLGRDAFGQDFLAFYSAGRIAAAGSFADLYDLAALSQWQAGIAREAGLTQAADVAPWWNPPYVAWLFAPLAKLPFHTALATWWAISLACLAGAAAILSGWVREASTHRREWLLVPAFLLVAPPTLHAIGHGQNTTLSLLLVTLVVAAWRGQRAILAGLACSLLFYKPQLAAIVSIALLATLGWRVGIGLMLGLVPQLLVTLTTMPGTIALFLERVPANLAFIQTEQAYLWHRHATFNGFWRFLLQGNAPGATHAWIGAIALVCIAAVGITLAWTGWKLRRAIAEDEVILDRFIALTVLATPLLMPFYFDYDLLLLGVAAVLIGRELLVMEDTSRAAWALRRVGGVTFVWLMANPALAESFGMNLTVPLLASLFALQARRCLSYSGDTGAPPLALPGQAGARLAA